jgi:hypothetical protein
VRELRAKVPNADPAAPEPEREAAEQPGDLAAAPEPGEVAEQPEAPHAPAPQSLLLPPPVSSPDPEPEREPAEPSDDPTAAPATAAEQPEAQRAPAAPLLLLAGSAAAATEDPDLDPDPESASAERPERQRVPPSADTDRKPLLSRAQLKGLVLVRENHWTEVASRTKGTLKQAGLVTLSADGGSATLTEQGHRVLSECMAAAE